MTQQEILEYNKRCAKFLGAIDNTHEWGFMLQPNELNLSFDLFNKKLFSNDEGSGWFVKDLKFHSDWNWIMEVVEKIQTLDKLGGIVMIQQGRCRITSRMAGDNTVYADVSYYYLHGMRKQKEAVVQAINQFLIWYNNEH